MQLVASPSKTEQLIKFLETEIMIGRLCPGERLPSMRKLAEQFGVSTMVVHQAASALEESGLLIRSPRRGVIVAENDANTRIVAGIITSIRRSGGMEGYFEELLKVMSHAGGVAIPISIRHDSPWEKDIKNLINQKPSGVFVDLEAEFYPLPKLLDNLKDIPVCFINRWEWDADLPANGVLTDYTGITVQTLRYLLNKGHRRIIFLGHRSKPRTFKLRQLTSAAKSVGLKFNSYEFEYACFEDFVHDPERVKRIFGCDTPPTAIFSREDSILFDFMSKVNRLYPNCQDMEMIGCFDSIWSRLPGQEFSSWHINFSELWSLAAARLKQKTKSGIEWIMPDFIERNAKQDHNVSTHINIRIKDSSVSSRIPQQNKLKPELAL